ncbi:hypothetical protein SOJ80_003843 [Cronobacter universalis]|nr:hypothetical protein [Cronobacter universalis]
MLHSVTLSYLYTPDEIKVHFDEHKAWLVEGFAQGLIILAGPLKNGGGGYILFNSEDIQVVEEFLSSDPFVKYELVQIDIVSTEPALCSKDFPLQWAPAANRIG